ncbi:SufD family Fe-S cluster assembly protein [Melaminivora alkalimesophila]|uniref:Fe-S cluster assembly protein SufD n=1 Tax=Melaminivora alkalimesophila TaxID=1165852 RepID=A0A317R9B8_9BURK|nr:SufD family Fe-S cluster assembly protein [Melaminivora alkalimesophila]PWW44670.1 Fe-S cluster assembly protein SufD [Melaminivora alkalimesophila]
MDLAVRPLDDPRAAREHLQQRGWIARRSEAFRNLPPPPMELWLGSERPTHTHDDTAAASGWRIGLPEEAAGTPPAVAFEELSALEPQQRRSLLAELPHPGETEVAPFAWAHRALCTAGARLRIRAAAEPVSVVLQHQPRSSVEAPLLVVELEPGAQCRLLEVHEGLDMPANSGAQVQNLQVHVLLGAGARLEHLRVAAPGAGASLAHHVEGRLAAGARYDQATVAIGASYHLQRNTVELLGEDALARHSALLLAGTRQLDHQLNASLQAAQARSEVETLTLAEGGARCGSSAHARIAPGADEASIHQRLSGVPLAGNPRLFLRPHLEILHDKVQAAHGATWGALPEDALFYAQQRGLDEGTARALVIEGMARAVLERSLGESPLLEDWLGGGWLAQALRRQLGALQPAGEGR